MTELNEMANKKPVSLKKLGIKKVAKGYEITLSFLDYITKVYKSSKDINFIKKNLGETNKAYYSELLKAEYLDDLDEELEYGYNIDLNNYQNETKIGFIDRQNETNWRDNNEDIADAIIYDPTYSDLKNVITNSFYKTWVLLVKEEVKEKTLRMVMDTIDELGGYIELSNFMKNGNLYNWTITLLFSTIGVKSLVEVKQDIINFATISKIEKPLSFNKDWLYKDLTFPELDNNLFSDNIYDAVGNWKVNAKISKDQLSLFESSNMVAVDIEEFFDWRDLDNYYAGIPQSDWFDYYNDVAVRKIDALFKEVTNRGLKKGFIITGINDYFYSITNTMARKQGVRIK